jgi:hypothetical protein
VPTPYDGLRKEEKAHFLYGKEQLTKTVASWIALWVHVRIRRIYAVRKFTFFSAKADARAIQRLEAELTLQLDRNAGLQEELEAQREAHTVVLATKESVLLSLLQQNLKLQNDYDALVWHVRY